MHFNSKECSTRSSWQRCAPSTWCCAQTALEMMRREGGAGPGRGRTCRTVGVWPDLCHTAGTVGIADEDGLENATFSYQWLADDTNIAGATGDTYTLADADEGKAMKVAVNFTDDAGHEESLTSLATDAVAAREETETESIEPPPSPTNLTATVNADGSVTLGWDAPDGDNVRGYQILRRRPTMGENSLSVFVDDAGNTDTTYTDEHVTAGVRNVYRVKAINAAGLSSASNYVRAEP